MAAATDAEALAAIRAVARAEGILPALETAHAIAALPRLLAGIEGSGRPYPDEAVVLLGLSGRGDKDLAALERRGRRAMSAAVAAPPAEAARGHERHGRRRDGSRAAFARARGGRPGRAHPVRRRRLSRTPRRRLRIALAAADAGADLLEVGLPYSDPLADGATLQRASGVALAAGATFAGSIALIERIAAARPGLPLVPMAYANQVIGGGDGGGDGAAPGRRPARAGSSSPT